MNKILTLNSTHFGSEKVFISLELLTQCNFRCSYCYIFNNEENKQLLATNDFKDDGIHTNNLQSVNKLSAVKTKMHFFLLGGEPTIYNGLPEIIENIYTLDVDERPDVEIVTNGKRFMDKKYVESLFGVYPDLRVTVSCHLEYLNQCNYPMIFNNIVEFINESTELVFYILLPEDINEFTGVSEEIFKIIDNLPKRVHIILSLVNGYDIRSKSKLIDEYSQYFMNSGRENLLNNELFDFSSAGTDRGPAPDIGRFQFLKYNADGRVNYRFCNYNIYVVEKDGSCGGTNCSIIKESINLLDGTSTDDDIDRFFSVRQLVCTEEQCPINCTCMPKRVVQIDFPDNET